MVRLQKSPAKMKSCDCAECGKSFLMRARLITKKYCSKECLTMGRQTGQEYPCAQCLTPVYRSPGQMRCAPRTQGVFCGDVCMGSYRRRKPNLCEDCGVELESGRQDRCRRCWASTLRTGKLYPCGQCETPVYMTDGKMRCAKRTKGVFCDRQCFTMFYTGKNNPQYVHGRSYIRRYPKEFRLARKKILSRDGHRCFLCQSESEMIGPHKMRSSLEVHHIDWNKHNNELWNLVTLCQPCHNKQRGTIQQVIERSGILSMKLAEAYGYQTPSTTSRSKATTTTSPTAS